MQAKTLVHNMKRKFIHSSKVNKPCTVILIQEMFTKHPCFRQFIYFLIHFHTKSGEATENINAISIHIRLTDYEKHLKHYYNMTTISKEYLVTAMTYMDKKYKV